MKKEKAKNQFIKTINKFMKRIGSENGYNQPLINYAAINLGFDQYYFSETFDKSISQSDSICVILFFHSPKLLFVFKSLVNILKDNHARISTMVIGK